MERCPKCGCPQARVRGYRREIHYDGCPTSLSSSKLIKLDLKRMIKSNIEYFKGQLKLWEEAEKDNCLDEVYECRWDCMAKLG